MKEIKSIGFHIPSTNDNYICLDSFGSLADADIAIFSPDVSTTKYGLSPDGGYEGKRLYNKESSASIKSHRDHWKQELSEFLNAGGTLFIVLSKKTDFFIFTGTKDISGTGRNQKVTNHVEPFSNYNFLPYLGVDFHIAEGKNLILKSNDYAEFYKNFKNILSYCIYIKTRRNIEQIFVTKKGDRVLGATFPLEGGHVVFLPDFNFNEEEFEVYDEDEDRYIWNEEGLKLGKVFINSVVEISEKLNSDSQKSTKPSWINDNDIALKTSRKIQNEIEKIEKEIQENKNTLKQLKLNLEDQESLKDLVYESGKPLEKAVIKALKILGYHAENYDDGYLELDQIILSPEGDRFIGECEGKDNKDIDVSKFRQLLDGLNADFEREDVFEKANGLLFGNPQRLIHPKERTLHFTQKCQSGAKREKVGLIKTVDLFTVCRYISETNDLEFAKRCRETIKNQLGEVIEFPAYE